MELFDSSREVFDCLETRSFVCFSAVGVFEGAPIILPKSRAPPGVLGVFDAPKEAKAPDPRPKALDAPAAGEEMVVDDGVVRLKGFLLLCDEPSPCLRPSVWPLVGWSPEGAPFVAAPPVERESLPELRPLFVSRLYIVLTGLGLGLSLLRTASPEIIHSAVGRHFSGA